MIKEGVVQTGKTPAVDDAADSKTVVAGEAVSDPSIKEATVKIPEVPLDDAAE